MPANRPPRRPRPANRGSEKNRLHIRPAKASPADLAAANAAVDAWQTQLWQRPIAERHQLIDQLLEGLHG